jgi:hypothetical protein
MKTMRLIVVASVITILTGCAHLFRPPLYWVDVLIENRADTKITDVSIGPSYHHSGFGIIGSKGAAKGAVVGIQFISDFPVEWTESAIPGLHRSKIDLSTFSKLKNRGITLFYVGDGMWKAELGREIK